MATKQTCPLWPQWVRVWEQWLHSTGTCVTTMGHIIELNSQGVQQSQRLVSFDQLILFDWVGEIVTFDWVKCLVSLLLCQIRLISFDWVDLIASSNTIEYAVWTSGVAKDPGAVNILPWSVFDVGKIQKRKDWSCLEVCRIHEEAKKIPN